jgi:hypothetical protein
MTVEATCPKCNERVMSVIEEKNEETCPSSLSTISDWTGIDCSQLKKGVVIAIVIIILVIALKIYLRRK